MNPRYMGDSLDQTVDVLISGAGPTGLAVAWEAVRAGLTVSIVSNRSADFGRVQRIALIEGDRGYLLGMIDKDETLNEKDRKIKHTLKTSDFIAIKDIEFFLKRRLDHAIKQGALILYHFNKIITQADLQTGVATIKKVGETESDRKESVSFNYLVGADGVGRHALSLVNDQLETPIHFEKETVGLPVSHASAYVTLQGEGMHDAVLDKIIKGGSERIGFFREGYQVNFVFAPGYLDKDKAIKCNIVIELPPEITRIEDKKERSAAIRQYMTDLVKYKFPDINFTIEAVAESKKHGPQKDNTKSTFFNTADIDQANSASAIVGRREFYLAGDAYRKPHYATGRGLGDGFDQARGLGRVFNSEINHEEYNVLSFKLGRDTSDALKEVDEAAGSIRKGRLDYP